MIARRLAMLMTVGALSASVASSSSLGKARELIESGKLAEARTILEGVAAGGQGEAEEGEALDLLATIAAATGDYAAAESAWRELGARFPGTVRAWEAQARLDLLADLLSCRGEGEPVSTSSPPPVSRPAPPPKGGTEIPAAGATGSSEPVQVAKTAPTAKAVEAEPEPAAPPPAPVPASAPERPEIAVPEVDVSGRVLLAGDGTPPEMIVETVAMFVDYLRAQGVDAEMVPQPLWWRRSFEMAQPALLDAMRQVSAAGLLWIDLRWGHRERLIVRCLDSLGREQWREKASGGTAFTDHRKHDRYNQKLVDKVQDRLGQRIGGSCLPVE